MFDYIWTLRKMSRGDKGTVLCLLCHLFILRAGRDDTGKSDSRRLRVQEVPCRRSAPSSGSVFRLPMEAHPAGGTAAHGRAEERKWNCPERTFKAACLILVHLFTGPSRHVKGDRAVPCLLRRLLHFITPYIPSCSFFTASITPSHHASNSSSTFWHSSCANTYSSFHLL